MDTRLEPDLPDLLWSLTDLFHRKSARVQRRLDDNENRQRRSQAEQDGSEIRSVELERLIAQGHTLIERRGAFELLRDRAAEHYEAHTGSAWRPRAGSMVNHKHLTAAMIDSRDFIAVKRKAETEVHLPAGPKIAFAGGVDCNDHHAIWAALDKVLAKHANMVLIHGGSPCGAERIAACWADKRKVTQIAFKPDWTRFKRNDRMLEVLPIGLVVFSGSGITDNLAGKAMNSASASSTFASAARERRFPQLRRRAPAGAFAFPVLQARLDGFGGGAELLDLTARKGIGWMDCHHWLTTQARRRSKSKSRARAG